MPKMPQIRISVASGTEMTKGSTARTSAVPQTTVGRGFGSTSRSSSSLFSIGSVIARPLAILFRFPRTVPGAGSGG